MQEAAENAYRTNCNFCGWKYSDQCTELIPIRCNVRKFSNEVFQMWRCQNCRCMHCWEVVDLDHYYNGYGTHQQKLDFFLRLAYREQFRRFRKSGLKREHRFLDYGCGAGLLVAYLQSRGYQHAVGYDPYGEAEGLNDASVLESRSYDFICLQDVLEHVEDPRQLIEDLSELLRPGGVLFVGMPSADEIDLNQTDKYLHQIHLPYHLHIYTEAALVQMTGKFNLKSIASYRRFYVEYPFVFGMNMAFVRRYVRCSDDTSDALLDPPRVRSVLCSPALLFDGFFGYFYSPQHAITVVFRAPP